LNILVHHLQRILSGDVKEMTLDIEDICVDLSKNNKKVDDAINFFLKNHSKINMGKYFCESYEKLKIDAELMIIKLKNKKNEIYNKLTKQ
jgi:hypothetical protein